MRLARQRVFSSRRARARTRRRHRRLRFEPLEARHLLAVLTVNSLADFVVADDLITLREAIALANSDLGEDTIRFAESLFDDDPATIETIQLGELGQLSITADLSIEGPAHDRLAIRGFGGSEEPGDGSRIFAIDDGSAATQISVTLARLELLGGDAGDDGGAILSREVLTVADGVVADSFSRGNGGGIANMGGRLSVVRSTISGNTASSGGGGLFSLGDLAVTGSTISGNHSSVDGGGIVGRLGNLSIDSSTISGNHAGTFGGGVIFLTAAGNSARIAHSTITDNSANQSQTASGSGGGVAALGDGPLVIDHTIVAGNFDERTGADDLSIRLQASFEAHYSLVGNNQGSGLSATADGLPGEAGNLVGTSNAPINPRLGPLADNGGPTQTHALLPDSPAINAGRPGVFAGQQGVPESDQRGGGFDRIVEDRIDIGAVEFDSDDDGGNGGGGEGGGGGGDGGGDDGDGGEDGNEQDQVFLLIGGRSVAESQAPLVDDESIGGVDAEVSLLNVIEPPQSASFPISDGAAGGGMPYVGRPLEQVAGPDPMYDPRVMQAVYYRPPVVQNEELVDAVFSLGEIELVSLMGVDMGDEPVFKEPAKALAKKAETAVAEALREPAPPIAPVPVAEMPEAPGWKSLLLWAALAGSCTLWISGTWWWMHRGRRNPK